MSIYCQVYLAADAERELGISREDFIALAYFLGSDYTEGIHGIGIVNSMEILQAFSMKEITGGCIDGLQKFKEWLRGYDFTKDILEDIAAKEAKQSKKLAKQQQRNINRLEKKRSERPNRKDEKKKMQCCWGIELDSASLSDGNISDASSSNEGVEGDNSSTEDSRCSTNSRSSANSAASSRSSCSKDIDDIFGVDSIDRKDKGKGKTIKKLKEKTQNNKDKKESEEQTTKKVRKAERRSIQATANQALVSFPKVSTLSPFASSYLLLCLVCDQLAFDKKHKTGRAKWSIPDNFPDTRVANAYRHPMTNQNNEKFLWKLPNLGKIHYYCAMVLGWTDSYMETSVDPVLQKYITAAQTKQLLQTRIDSHFLTSYEDNARFAKIASSRLQEAVIQITGKKTTLAAPKAITKKRTATSQNATKGKKAKLTEQAELTESVEQEGSQEREETTKNENPIDAVKPTGKKRGRQSTKGLTQAANK